jgi:hypothetical protein
MDIETILEMYEDNYNPSSMVPGPRNMYDGGGAAKQLLAQPSVDGFRPGYATSTVKKGKFKYPVTNQMGTVYSDKKPASSAREVGSGKFSMGERNRVTRIKYPEYNSYAELLKKEPTKAKNVMATLQYSSVAGSKIKKKTQYTPLTTIQQNKILAEFPDADFSKGKFGFNQKADQTNFVRVKKFVERGYKPRFKQLPDKVKNQLKEKFSEFKDWDFKKFKYGVPDTLNNVENRKLMMKVKTFINDPKPYMFGFSLDKPGAWMTQQMYRAWEHGNTDYEPKYNKNGKVVGMYEKGKLYYANKNVADIDGAKKAKLINSHPEFNNVQKFVDVANEAKLPLKKLGGYTNTKALLALFPDGYEKIKFSDLTNYIYKEVGADATRNAIEKHHLKNLADMGAPIDSKNLQLLRQDLNTLGNTITEQIKKGDFSRVEDLEKAGVKITVDGKTYGKGFQDPRRQMNVLIGETTKKIQSLDENKFKTLLTQLCPKGKASGGRIGFNTAGAVLGSGANCGRNHMNKLLKNGTGTTEERNLIRQIMKAGFDFAKGTGKAAVNLLNPKEFLKLKNWVGGPAMAFMAGVEGLDVADRVVRQGIPIKEALGEKWTSFLMPRSLQEYQIKGMEKANALSSPASKRYAKGIELSNDLVRAYDQLEMLETGEARKLRKTSDVERIAELKKLIRTKEKKYYDYLYQTDEKGNVLGDGELDFKKDYNEYRALTKRGRDFTDLDIFGGMSDMGTDKMSGLKIKKDYFPMYEIGTSKIPSEQELAFDATLAKKPFVRERLVPLKQLKDFEYQNKELPTQNRIDAENFFTEHGVLPPRTSLSEIPLSGKGDTYDLLKDLTDDYNRIQKSKEARMYPAYGGSQFSEGGITGLRSKYEYKK